jgi:hypothetical protein
MAGQKKANGVGPEAEPSTREHVVSQLATEQTGQQRHHRRADDQYQARPQVDGENRVGNQHRFFGIEHRPDYGVGSLGAVALVWVEETVSADLSLDSPCTNWSILS